MGDPDFPSDAEDCDDTAPAGTAKRRLMFKTMRQRQVSQAIGAALIDIGERERGSRLLHCCTRLVVDQYENGWRISPRTRFCRDLVCQVCGVRQAKVRQHDARRRVEHYLTKNPGQQAIFLTLTAKSCPPAALKAHVSDFMASVVRLFRRAAVCRVVKAWVRAYELTYDPTKQTFHFHAHLILFVEREAYFAKDSPLYLTQAVWAAEWQAALRVDYRPVVDIRATTITSPLNDAGRKALLEVVKYTFKPGSIVARVDGEARVHGETDLIPFDCGDGLGVRPVAYAPLRAVAQALKSRKMVAFSANLGSPDDDLDFTDKPNGDGEEPGLGAFVCREIYRWRATGRGGGRYQLVRRSFDKADLVRVIDDKPKKEPAMPP